MKDHHSKKIFVEGKQQGNMYVFQEDPSACRLPICNALKPPSVPSFAPSNFVFSVSDCNKPDL